MTSHPSLITHNYVAQHLLQFILLGPRQVDPCSLAKGCEQKDWNGGTAVESDHAATTSLTFAFSRPSELSGSTGTCHLVADVRLTGQKKDKVAEFFFAQQTTNGPLKL